MAMKPSERAAIAVNGCRDNDDHNKTAICMHCLADAIGIAEAQAILSSADDLRHWREHSAAVIQDKEMLRRSAALTESKLHADVATLARERDDARAVASILVHAYDHDSRPPDSALSAARAWLPRMAAIPAVQPEASEAPEKES